ncbi:hypothetical protein D3C77_789690 [compost metagenome]
MRLVLGNLDIVHQRLGHVAQIIGGAQEFMVILHIPLAHQMLDVAQQDRDMLIGSIDGDTRLDA